MGGDVPVPEEVEPTSGTSVRRGVSNESGFRSALTTSVVAVAMIASGWANGTTSLVPRPIPGSAFYVLPNGTSGPAAGDSCDVASSSLHVSITGVRANSACAEFKAKWTYQGTRWTITSGDHE